MNECFYYNKLKAKADIEPDRIVIKDLHGRYSKLSDYIGFYEYINGFFKDNQIKPHQRIAVIVDNPILLSLLYAPLVEKSVYVPIKGDLKGDKFQKFISFLSVDYIITNNPENDIIKLSREAGVGIIYISHEYDKSGIKMQIASAPIGDRCKNKSTELAYITTTSGTTGEPKIVPVTKKANIASFHIGDRLFGYNDENVTMVVIDVQRSTSLNSILKTIAAGGRVVLAAGANHGETIEAIIKNSITNFTAVPAYLESLAEYIESNGESFEGNTLRFIRSSGAPLTEKLRERLEKIFKTEIVQSYGMTETKMIACTYKAPFGHREGSAGLSAGLEVKICEGEILVKGDTVFKGYENETKSDSLRFSSGWFHTGDMGYIDKDGYIYVTGRIKEMINRGGEKISPYEVENVILKHPDILETAVFAYPNNYGSEEVGAAIVTKGNKEIGIKEVRAFLMNEINSYKMPTLLYFVERIPKNESGKINRKTLFGYMDGRYPEILKQIGKVDVHRYENMTQMQKTLIKIWRRYLKKTKIGIEDRFTDLGGDSLSGAAVLANIQSETGVNVPVEMLFGEGTIQSIEQYISNILQAGHKEYEFLVPIREQGGKRPLICAHAGGGTATTYRHLGKYVDIERPVYAFGFDMKKEQWPLPLTFDALAKRYALELTKFDPTGPYFLTGYCWGGVLAFEIARQLCEQGRKVAMLVMIDAEWKTGIHGKKPNNGIGERLGFMVDDIRAKSTEGGKRNLLAIVLRRIRNSIRWFLTKNIKRIYELGYKLKIRPLINIAGAKGMLSYAYKNYNPSHFKGKIHFIKAGQGKTSESQNEIFWTGKADELELITLDGRHNELIHGEKARALAESISQIMNECE